MSKKSTDLFLTEIRDIKENVCNIENGQNKTFIQQAKLFLIYLEKGLAPTESDGEHVEALTTNVSE